MAFNVNEFSANLNERGVAKQSHYDVIMTLPSGLSNNLVGFGNDVNALTRHLALRCVNAELPGRALNTQEHRVYGPIRKYAYGMLNDDFSITFLCSVNLREKVFFEQWMEYISGMSSVPNQQSTYNIQYYEKYTAPRISIIQYDPATDSPIYTCQVNEAYPVTINAMDLSWESEDVHRVTIQFSYYTWERANWQDIKMDVRQNTSLFGNLGGLLGTAAGVAATQLPQEAVQVAGAATAVPNIIRNISNIQ